MESPEFFHPDGYSAGFTPQGRHADAMNVGDNFSVEDLLDLPSDDVMAAGDSGFADMEGGSGSSSRNAAGGDRGFASADICGPDAQFCGELCLPNNDLELEELGGWLTNLEEEAFSSEDLQKLQLIQGIRPGNYVPSDPGSEQCKFQHETSPPAKAARSKRTRAAPGDWTSRILTVSPEPPLVIPAPTISSLSASNFKKAAARPAYQKKKEGSDSPGSGGGNIEGRKCLHCATEKTPQWRTGPLGPKTLCNACGVRYKSGRLVPEYRPAASPTFVLTKHSNSHRKVVELRRQKEMMRAQQQQQIIVQHHQNMAFGVPNDGEDYLIHQNIGPDFRQLI